MIVCGSTLIRHSMQWPDSWCNAREMIPRQSVLHVGRAVAGGPAAVRDRMRSNVSSAPTRRSISVREGPFQASLWMRIAVLQSGTLASMVARAPASRAGRSAPNAHILACRPRAGSISRHSRQQHFHRLMASPSVGPCIVVHSSALEWMETLTTACLPAPSMPIITIARLRPSFISAVVTACWPSVLGAEILRPGRHVQCHFGLGS